jgi:hypothetical protein
MNTESIDQSRGASELFSTKFELKTWPKHVPCQNSIHTGGYGSLFEPRSDQVDQSLPMDNRWA